MLQSVNESLGDRDVFWLKLFMRNCCDWIDNAVVVLHAASMCMYDSKVTLILGICRLYSPPGHQISQRFSAKCS